MPIKSKSQINFVIYVVKKAIRYYYPIECKNETSLQTRDFCEKWPGNFFTACQPIVWKVFLIVLDEFGLFK